MATRLKETNQRRLAREIGVIHKAHGFLRFVLAFPNTYYVGMSNLGFQLVYRLLNEMDDTLCERVFLPDPPDLADLLRTNTPLLSMESSTPVRSFDVIAFSVSYELDYLNVLKMLSLSRMDELSTERDETQPLVILGGPAVTLNPEPLAPFADAIVIGEAEEVLREIVDVLARHTARLPTLQALARIEGVYIPRFYHPSYRDDGTIRAMEVTDDVPPTVRRRWVRSLDGYDPTGVIVTPETEFSNMVLTEVARGCGRQCRFCAAGYAYLPPRARSADAVLQAVDRLEEQEHGHGAIGRIGLLSASVFDHPSSVLVCEALAGRGRRFSISSTRLDTLNRDIVNVLRRGGHGTLTIAPEAGTERLRLVINKVMSDADVLDSVSLAWDGGFRRLKLYYMVGLPTETEEDIEAIRVQVSEISEKFGWEKVTVSTSCFVPKPWTPFQWAGMQNEKLLAGKMRSLRESLRRLKSVTVAGESPREALLQGVLARGDRRLQEPLLLINRRSMSWAEALRSAGVDPAFYASRCRQREEVFPWDHLDLGVRKSYLWQEYERALTGVAGGACEVGVCRTCGVCDAAA